MSTTSRNVTFRLSLAYHARLTEIAASEHLSRGDYARLRVLESMDDDGGRQEVMASLTRIEAGLADLRHDLPLAAQALLIATGQRHAYTPEEAETWARENLKTQA